MLHTCTRIYSARENTTYKQEISSSKMKPICEKNRKIVTLPTSNNDKIRGFIVWVLIFRSLPIIIIIEIPAAFGAIFLLLFDFCSVVHSSIMCGLANLATIIHADELSSILPDFMSSVEPSNLLEFVSLF